MTDCVGEAEDFGRAGIKKMGCGGVEGGGGIGSRKMMGSNP